MTPEQMAILGLLLAQLSALYALHKARKERDYWKAVSRRNAPLRDPKTGRFINMGKIK
jgi:hypothetical protein